MSSTGPYHDNPPDTWICKSFCNAKTPAVTGRTLALVPRAKYPHCSARARDGLASLPPLHSLTHLLHRFRRSLPLISKSSKLTRPSMKTAGAPKLQTAKTSSLRSSRGSNLHCVPVLADRARAWRLKQNGRATSSGQKIISPRCFARARHSNTARGVAYRRRQKH